MHGPAVNIPPPSHGPEEQCDGQDDTPEASFPCSSAAVQWCFLEGFVMSRCGRHEIRTKSFNGRPVAKASSYEEALVRWVMEA